MLVLPVKFQIVAMKEFITRIVKWLTKPLKDQPRTHPVEPYYNSLTRQRVEDLIYGGVGLPGKKPSGRMRLIQFRYWCKCGTELTDGPTGGAAVNAVCEKCHKNYGELPGYWGH